MFIFSPKKIILVEILWNILRIDFSLPLSLQEHQRGIQVPLTTLVNFVDITQKPEPPRDQPRTDWKLPFDFFFPFKVAFSRGARAQEDSASPLLVLCIFLLGVLNSQTKWRERVIRESDFFPMGNSKTAYLSWLKRSLLSHDYRRSFRETEPN